MQLPNWVDEMPLKLMRVQTHFITPSIETLVAGVGNLQAFEGPDPVLDISELSTTLFPIDVLPDTGSGTPVVGVLVQDFAMMPNPDWEYLEIYVPEGTAVGQVVIDTVSIPEPATLLLLAVGSLTTLLRRR